MRRLLPASNSVRARLVRLEYIRKPVTLPPNPPPGLKKKIMEVEDTYPYPTLLLTTLRGDDLPGTMHILYLDGEDGWNNLLNFAAMYYLRLSATTAAFRADPDPIMSSSQTKRRWYKEFPPLVPREEEEEEEVEEEEEDPFHAEEDEPPEDEGRRAWGRERPRREED